MCWLLRVYLEIIRKHDAAENGQRPAAQNSFNNDEKA